VQPRPGSLGPAWTTAELLACQPGLANVPWARVPGHDGISWQRTAILKALDAGAASQVELPARGRIGPQSLAAPWTAWSRDGSSARGARSDRRQMIVVRTRAGDRVVAAVDAAAALGASAWSPAPDPQRFRSDQLLLIDSMSEACEDRRTSPRDRPSARTWPVSPRPARVHEREVLDPLIEAPGPPLLIAWPVSRGFLRERTTERSQGVIRVEAGLRCARPSPPSTSDSTSRTSSSSGGRASTARRSARARSR